MRRLASRLAAVSIALAAVSIGAPAASASGSVITTTAGTGVAGYSGDGGPATAAQLTSPAGVAVDGSGNVYVADDGANVVRRIATNGTISTIAGTGTAGYSGNGGAATAAKLNGPTDVVLDAAGNLYIADYGNHVVRKVLTNGTISTVAGTGVAGYTGDGGQGTSAKLTAPGGLDVDSAGNVYIADYGNATVRKLSTTGVITTIAGTGTAGYSGDGGPATAAKLNRPGDVIVVGSAIYVADAANYRVRLIDGTGTITTVAGNGVSAYAGDGGAPTAASMVYPTGLATDSSGDLFIADMYGHTIREVSAGTITTVAGTGVAGYSGDGGVATAAQLNNPARVNLDPAGNLYLSDWTNHRLRMVAMIGAPAAVPDAPTGVSATAGNASAGVSWTTPANDGGSAITGYTVIPNDGTTDLPGVPVSAATTTTTITGLANGTTYTFTVVATNAIGDSAPSAASNAVTPTAPPPAATVPDAPTGVTATAGNTTAGVSWTAPAGDGGSPITGYTVIPNNGTIDLPGVQVSAATTGTTISGLTNGIAYTFTVVATNGVGDSAPSVASNAVTPVAPSTVPGSPTGVTATAGDTTADLSWSAPAGDGGSPLTGYTITPNDGTTDLPAVPVSAATTSTTITGLTNGTTYTFTVVATNAIGDSNPSSPTSPVTPTAGATVPDMPSGVTATAGIGRADVAWSAPAGDGGSPLTGYKVIPNNGTTDLPAVTVGTTTSTTITGLTNGTTYTFTVVASNALGDSAPSAPSNAVTPTATVPDAPAAATATAGDGQAHLSWSAPAGDGGSAVTGYTITPNDGTTNLPGVPVFGTSTSTTVTGLTNGTTYTFTVVATNAIGDSTPSAPSNAVTPTAPTAPNTPTAVTATAGDTTAGVSWTAPANDGGSPLTGYKVIPNDGTTDLPAVTVGTTTGTTITGLTNGTTYTFTVVATNAVGDSTPSVPSNAVTPTAPPPAATAPNAPTAVAATAGDTTADVTWSAPANDGGSPLTGYKVIPNDGTTDLPAVTVGTTTSTTITGLTNGTTYTFTVVATNAVGDSTPSTPSDPVTPVAAATTDPTTPAPADPPATDQPPAADPPADDQPSVDNPPAAPQEPTPAEPVPALSRETTPAFPSTVPAPAPRRHHRPAHRAHPVTPAGIDTAREPLPLAPTHASHPAPHRHQHHAITWRAFRNVAVAVSKRSAVPVGLLLLVGLFLTVQNRLDRRDPKLALAPVYADPGVAFVPVMS